MEQHIGIGRRWSGAVAAAVRQIAAATCVSRMRTVGIVAAITLVGCSAKRGDLPDSLGGPPSADGGVPVTAGGGGGSGGGGGGGGPTQNPLPNPIPIENARPGDADWTLALPAGGHALEGYGSRITLAPGDGLDVAVNVATAQPVSWRVYRIGWYGGAGARLVDAGGPVMVAPQPPCPRDPTTSRVECSWATAFHVAVAADALSGVYVIKLHDASNESYVPFVVHDNRVADVVVNVNVTSWQAYNDWDGESLYADASGTMPHGKAWEVSYDRPFANDYGAGRLFDLEADSIRFLEGNGYDVTYTTAFDLGHDSSQVRAARAFLSVANDEYWTVPERTAVEAARDQGVNCIFLGADQIYWRLRPEPSTSGVAERVLAGYKDDQDRDPVLAAEGPTASTALFRDPPLANPENALSGVGYDSWLLEREPFVVRDAQSWVFAGTGLHDGDNIPFGVAAEYDTRLADGVEPPGLQVLASSPVINAYGLTRRSAATIYQAPSGAQVFAVGSIGWVNGLGDGPYTDWRVGRITRNVLDRFVGPGHEGAPDPAGAPWARPLTPPTIVGAWSPSVVTIAGAADGAPAGDGPGATARFAGPGGVAVAADGSVYVADTEGQSIRRIASDAAHTVTTIAGGTIDGYADGPGSSARFRWPLGLAVAADGTLLVADSVNNCIRAVAPDAAHTVTTYAGSCSPVGGFADGAATSAQFETPVAVAVAPDGGVLVADQYNDRVRRIAPATHDVTTLAGGAIGFADGPGASARFNGLSGVAVAGDGTVYVVDTYNQAIRRIGTDAAHTVTTLIGGDGIPAAYVDGAGTVARLGAQGGLAWSGGRLFVSDVAGNRIRVVTPGVDAASTTVATLAGNGASLLTDGDGAHAAFALPTALAASPDGRLWTIDAGNSAIRAITLPTP